MWRSTLRACLFSRGSLTAAKPRQTHCRKQLTDRNRAQIIFGLNLISNAYAQNPLSMLPPLFTPSRSYSGLATVEEAPSIPTLEIKNVQTELDIASLTNEIICGVRHFELACFLVDL
jgi:hypothetical protein